MHAEGKRIRTKLLDVRGLASLRAYGRVGIVVPRFGHTAVDRNTVKRRLRELARVALLPGLARMDVVLKATPAAYRATFDALRAEMVSVRERTRDVGPDAALGTARPPNGAPA